MLKERLRASIESTASSKEELAGDSKMAAMRFDDDEEESPMKIIASAASRRTKINQAGGPEMPRLHRPSR